MRISSSLRFIQINTQQQIRLRRFHLDCFLAEDVHLTVHKRQAKRRGGKTAAWPRHVSGVAVGALLLRCLRHGNIIIGRWWDHKFTRRIALCWWGHAQVARFISSPCIASLSSAKKFHIKLYLLQKLYLYLQYFCIRLNAGPRVSIVKFVIWAISVGHSGWRPKNLLAYIKLAEAIHDGANFNDHKSRKILKINLLLRNILF